MFITKMLTVGAIALGGAMVGVSNNADTTPIPVNGNLTEHYFQFNGANGQEDQPAQWQEITPAQYDDVICDGLLRGCKLQASDVTQDASGDLHPTQVYVDVDPNNPDNMKPKTGTGVEEVKNKVNSY